MRKEEHNKSAKFYQDLSGKYTKDKEVFLPLVKENQKNMVAIERAYYGVITGPLPSCSSEVRISQKTKARKSEILIDLSYEGIMVPRILSRRK